MDGTTGRPACPRMRSRRSAGLLGRVEAQDAPRRARGEHRAQGGLEAGRVRAFVVSQRGPDGAPGGPVAVGF